MQPLPGVRQLKEFNITIGNFSRLALPENWEAFERSLRMAAGADSRVELTFTVRPRTFQDIRADDVQLTVTFRDKAHG